ncbi:MAG: DUF1616 domain-containing protein [Euryarchaeota archaeon]|nr:DUF1616 domain-containing protein [Euryarchaeota archaeon]MDE1836102.1 DUF1616 domain-containing protein [Euryarchaeota archaeon]MDE1879392.1 DUF1616 domain-containing protein [Euryarchaeota archaeon]MDE2044080.1 DUF1616 domain-containing protein [Thermoplasmata archaeon]
MVPPVNPIFALGALALFFFAPGYLMMKALWPEKRWKGPRGTMDALELLTGGFVASLSIFLVVGFVLGNTGTFAAAPSDPVLEGVLATFALGFLALGWIRGAYRAEPPPAPSFVEPPLPGEEDVEPLLERFQALSRREREARRELRTAQRSGRASGDVERLKAELQELGDKRRRMEKEREEELRG